MSIRDALAIACRGQHIERWLLPRKDFPEGREGYLTWRREQGRRHAERVMGLMRDAGYPEPEVEAAGRMLRKEGIKRDAEVQALEDVACFTFIRHYLGDFATTQDPDQLLRIVQEMEDAAGRGDLVAVTEADIDFHTTLVSLAHSPRLTRMHTTLMVETRMCITALEHRYSSQSPRLQEHRHIAEAIGRADLAGLDRLLDGHMEDAIGRLVAPRD